MKRNLMTAAFAATLAIGVDSASAETVLITFEEQGMPIVDDSVSVDLLGSFNGDSYLGLDSLGDVNYTENPSPGDNSGRFGVNSRSLGGSIYQQGDLARDSSGNLITYTSGDEVDSDDFDNSNGGSAILYNPPGSADPGIIPNDNDSVILGFRFQIIDQGPCFGEESSFDECYFRGETGILDINVEEGGIFESVVLETYFGFAQISHGSVIPGILGLNNSSGRAAVVPSLPDPNPNVVPLPAAGWMLLAGLGGIAAMRRKKP